MGTRPTFSIVTVSLNAADLIARTCDSVDAQTFTDYEHLILDGLSSDGTLDVVAARPNPRRRVTAETDAGIYDAMNKAAMQASGDWVVYLNAGDAFVAAETLQLVAEQAGHGGARAAVMYGDTLYIELDGTARLTPAAGHERTLEQLPYCHQSMFVRREVLRDHPFNKHFSIVADYDQMIRLYLGGVGFQRLPFAIARFPLGGVSYVQETRRHVEAVKMLFDHLGNSGRRQIEDVIWRRLSGKVMRYLRLREAARSPYAIFGTGRYAGRLVAEIRRHGLREPDCLLGDGLEADHRWGLPLVEIDAAPPFASVILGSAADKNRIIRRMVAKYPHFDQTRLIDLDS